MSEKTLVLDIQELYSIVPETKSLEGTNFKDIRELLVELIATVEATGQWEFIQYISNKPSLFIIRKIEVDNNQSQHDPVKLREMESIWKDVNKMYKKIKNNEISDEKYVEQPPEMSYTPIKPGNFESHVPTVNGVHKADSALKTSEMKKAEREIDTIQSEKLPWEK